MHRVILRLEYIFNTVLEEYMIASTQQWVDFLAKFYRKQAFQNDFYLQEKPLMKIKIEVIQIKKDQESKKRGNKKDKGKIEKKQKTEYKVDFHPNQQDINAFFLKVISKKVLAASKSLLVIEKDMCPFISNETWKTLPALELDTEVSWIKEAL